MHLVARRDLDVLLRRAPLTLRLASGEDIRTEISCKFTRDSAEDMLGLSGLRLERWFTDPDNLFALALAAPA